jgi:hypothetical protein
MAFAHQHIAIIGQAQKLPEWRSGTKVQQGAKDINEVADETNNTKEPSLPEKLPALPEPFLAPVLSKQ